MRRPTPAVAAFRRRLLLWAPLALAAAVVYVLTFPLMNGATVLAGLVLVAAAFAAVVDDGEDRAA
ncbi:hypothetical protein [Zhihengliuella sp.]|uniref:hypothetical protein n=1 Tax=Zhihengliuella sp. TaxID=1954483 RepID=UPI002811276E|nr:hypothetical protein [Zhihengliuella sp.]